MNTTTFCAYTVMDADRGERFSTTDHESVSHAWRRRNELALKWGKEICLRVAGIDSAGELHELSDDDLAQIEAAEAR